MIVPVHTAFGVIALVAGGANLLRRKGTSRHRQIGWIYAGAMYALLLTSFFIYEAFGQFGVFHVLSIFSGVTLTVALYFPLRRWHHPHWMAHHYMWISYSYIGLVMATGSHLMDAVPGWPFAVRAFLFWGVPWLAGTVMAFAWLRRILAQAAATLATVAPERSPTLPHAGDDAA